MLPYDPAFVTPRYDGLSFAAIPVSIAGLLTGAAPLALAPETLGNLPARYRNVVVILIDGFGWRFFEKYAADYPALRRFTGDGVCTQISSQFPSTTTAHVTTLHTGLPVSQHGMYEWQYFEPKVGRVIIPLLFSYAGTHDRDQLKAAKVDPRSLLPTQTLYHELNRLGITSTVFQHREYTPSTFGSLVFDGAAGKGIPHACRGVRQSARRAGRGEGSVILRPLLRPVRRARARVWPETRRSPRRRWMPCSHRSNGSSSRSCPVTATRSSC